MRRIALLVVFFTIIFSIKAFSQSWKPGAYYDTTFTKVSGLIKSSDTYISFKKDKKADKQKIPAFAMNSYKAGTDSFTVSHMPGLEKMPILKVLIDNPVKLYYTKQSAKLSWGSVLAGVAIGVGTGVATGVVVSPNIGSGGGGIYYFYGYGPDDVQQLTHKNFITVMSGIMSDKPEIVERIKDKTANINNLEEWVAFYLKERKNTLPAVTQ